MKKLLLVAFIFGLATATLAQEQASPFGLHMGMNKSELDIQKELKTGVFQLKTIPKPHSAFEAYVAKVGPKSGLCWIKALGRNVKTSVYGTELQIELKSLRNSLSGVYGKSELIDMLMPKSIWNESNEWMMGVLKGERLYSVRWSLKDGSTMKPGLAQIYLSAQVLSQNTGFVALEYYFDNHDVCDKEIAAEGSKVF